MRCIRSSSSAVLTEVEKACCTSSPFGLCASIFDISRAEMSINFGRLDAAHIESTSLSKSRLCFGTSIYGLDTEKVPAQRFKAMLRGRVKFLMMYFIYKIFFWSRRIKALNLNALKQVWKTCSSCRRREKLKIWFLYPGCVDFMLPEAL